MKEVIVLYLSKYLKPLSVNEISFPFLLSISLTNSFPINSEKYSLNLSEDKLDFLFSK